MNGLRMSFVTETAAVRNRLVDQVNQQRALDHHDLEIEIVVARRVRMHFHIADDAVLGGYVDIRVRPLRQVCVIGIARRNLAIHQRHVRAGANVLLNHRLKRRVHDVIAAGQNHVFLLRTAQIVEIAAQRLDHAGVFAAVIAGQKWRKDKQTVVARVQIPFLAGAEMIHQRMIVPLRDHANIAHAGINQIRKRKIDNAITTGDGKGGDRAICSQLAELEIVLRGVNDAHYVTHALQPPSC